jgi:hypothetical protein|tara:strand:- start:78 stop:719 length:642 start_codon:yes stop_codon:yes gene_type:complete
MAFSFTKQGFGGFSDPNDPTDPITKKVKVSTKKTSVMTPQGIDNIYTDTYKTTTTIAGGGKLPYAGSESFQKAFGAASKAGLSTFEFKGKPYTTELYKPKTPIQSVQMSSDTYRRAGLRFTGNTNITANTNIQPIKMNGGGDNPTITPKRTPKRPPRTPKKPPFTPFKWVPEVIEDIGDAFSSLRLFRKGRGRRRGGRGCGFCAKKLLKTMRR